MTMEQMNVYILRATGSETMEQVVDTHEAESRPRNGVVTGEPTYGGAYTLYNIQGFLFEVTSRYKLIEPIGRGAYGIVCSCNDLVTGHNVAIKKIQDAVTVKEGENAFAVEICAKRVLREIITQRHMNHPNVARVLDVIVPPNPKKFRDVYIVYELMPSDLDNAIRNNVRKPRMDDRHFKHILFNLLRGLNHIHEARVLHRDLKPSNILIDTRCNIKITDLGLARTKLGVEDHMTNYVVTRYYRAPELLLDSSQYSEAVDMWSIGCIFLELISGKVALPGQTTIDQLRKIIELVGSPKEESLARLPREFAKIPLFSFEQCQRQNFQALYPQLTPLAADLMERIFVFDPSSRITVKDALRHPYFEAFSHIPDDVPAKPMLIDLSFVQEEYNTSYVRQLIYEQACDFIR